MSKRKADTVLAYVTFPNQKTAAEICEPLVRDHVIACANIYPEVSSMYRWKDELIKDKECVAVLKTAAFKTELLKERIRAVHPYENPCLVVFPISDGLPAFLNWVYSESL
jgi:periplasmic divalent cation tolerance protein